MELYRHDGCQTTIGSLYYRLVSNDYFAIVFCRCGVKAEMEAPIPVHVQRIVTQAATK